MPRQGAEFGENCRRVAALTWPAVAEQLLLTTVGLADVYIVGHLGATVLGGVGLGGQAYMIAFAVCSSIGVGATAIVARLIGAGESTEASHLAAQALMTGAGVGLLLALLGIGLTRPLMAMFKAPVDVTANGVAWLRVVAPSFVFLGILLVGTACLRGAGDTRSPMAIMIAVSIVNITLAVSLTRGLFSLPNLGVRGAAVGAAAGHIVGGLLMLTKLKHGSAGLRLQLAHLRPDLARVLRVLRVGLPVGIEQVMLDVATAVLAAILAQAGAVALAAHQVTLRLVAVALLPGWGVGVAAATLVGQALGAQRPERARALVFTAWILGLGVMASVGAALYLCAAPLLRFFTGDPQIVSTGVPAMRIAALMQPAAATAYVLIGALRGAGDTRAAMLGGVAATWGVRLTTAYYLSTVLGLGLTGVWLGMTADYLCRAVLFLGRFQSGRWEQAKV